MSRERLQWDLDGADWPHRQASRFVVAAGVRWHVQSVGTGPVLLLVHGTGAGSFSWRAVASLLAERFTVVIPDLPGHAFTEVLNGTRPTLHQMSAALGQLLRELELQPAIAVGHSAGAAIVIRMALDGLIAPRALISVNGALLPPQGLTRLIFSPAAKLLSRSSLIPHLAARRAADAAAISRLLASTGSTIDAHGAELYRRVVGSRAHVQGVLQMMAHWDVESIQRDVGRLPMQLILVVGDNDRTVDPREARRVQALLPSARIVMLNALGHLAHEEAPQQIAALIHDLAGAAHC